ncbi:MAG: nucleotidyltransferase domain-containing protein [Sinobacteraceae bacterium]|nr:nucleotidyltransferase domain-containing protein [Nevskiaceae bacterium]
MANDTISQLVAMLSGRIPGLIAVYRFGSFGTPAQRRDSDIDLGVLADAPLDPVALFHMAAELATCAKREIDLVDLIRCSTVMRAHIISTGEIVYCSDPYRSDNFAATAYSRYAHLNEARSGILADIQARGSIHGR